MRALVIAKDSPTIQKLKQLLGQSYFDCLQAEDWIEAIRWSTDESLDLIVTELNSAAWKGDKVFELAERGAFGESPPPMIVLTRSNRHSGFNSAGCCDS
jgi:DNA-binding response OmpR family regulator